MVNNGINSVPSGFVISVIFPFIEITSSAFRDFSCSLNGRTRTATLTLGVFMVTANNLRFFFHNNLIVKPSF